MMASLLNRLWVRFSLSITGIILVVTVLPTASLLLSEPQEVTSDWRARLHDLNQDPALSLSTDQIDLLASQLTRETRHENTYDVVYLMLTTLIVGVFSGALLGRGLSLPIERLAHAIQTVRSQELPPQVEVKGPQEIRQLAENFNRMTTELALAEQWRQNMMADISHELLTPLTVLQGNLRAILEDVYELNKDEVGVLYEQNKHLIRLVRDLRQLAQAEAGQLEFQITTIDLAQLAVETATFFEPTVADKNLTLTHEFAPNLPGVWADGDRLRQVIHNLCANAVRHTPAGGQITLRAEQAGHGVQLAICDTGIGIEADQQPYVFDRFYRTADSRRRDSGGAGLGLAIAKALILAMHGRISVTSTGPNQGSEFTVWLPAD